MMRRRIRITVRGMIVLVALAALLFGAGMHFLRSLTLTRKLVTQLESGQSASERGYAALNLFSAIPPWERGDVLRGLRAAVNDRDLQVRACAAIALSLSIGVPASVLEDQQVYQSLPPALKDREPHVRVLAARALAKHKGHSAEVIPLLLESLKDESPSVRTMALTSLGQMIVPGSPAVHTANPSLAAAMDDPAPEVRMEAARALRVIGSGRLAIPGLIRSLRNGQGSERYGALDLLIRMKAVSAQVEPFLIEMLERGDIWQRLSASHGLIMRHKSDLALPMLLAVAGDSARQEEVRMEAVRLLLKIQDGSHAIPILRDMVNDRNCKERTRHMAAQLLEEAAGERDETRP